MLREHLHDEAFMNSAAVHGNDTRVKLEVLEPALRAQLKEAAVLRTALRAEVACLTQFVLSRAAVHAQKNVEREASSRRPKQRRCER